MPKTAKSLSSLPAIGSTIQLSLRRGVTVPVVVAYISTRYRKPEYITTRTIGGRMVTVSGSGSTNAPIVHPYPNKNGIYYLKFREPQPVPLLTPADWAEIYYALDFKLKADNAVIGTDRLARQWRKHLRTLLETIGPDGENMDPWRVETDAEFFGPKREREC